MRATLRLLANVKPGRFLEANNPTGLTGLFTHPSPRSSLIALYNETLHRLDTLPEHSVYRQSVEAITSHRLKIVESMKPEGFEEWFKVAREKFEAHPELFRQWTSTHTGRSMPETDDREVEWDGERIATTAEGVRTQNEKAYLRFLGRREPPLGTGSENISLEPEPLLDATQ